MILSKRILTITFILIPTLIFSQNTLTNKEKNEVLQRIKVLIDSNYVFINKVAHVNHSLDSLNAVGYYDDIVEYKVFATSLTESLVNITNDKHFKVQYNPKLIKSRREWRRQQEQQEQKEVPENNNEVEVIDWNEWYARKENFGFEKIEILDGNIGYIKFNFWQPLEWVKPTIDATMNFVTNTDALIIDLTENQGGYSPTDSYLGSYFFDKNPILWSSRYDRPTSETEEIYTFQEIGGSHYFDKPVFILVSENTFSLAEQFAYGMKHFGKATIVGQTSAGAAHAINFLEIDGNYGIQVPVLYNIHPVTKTDWEGTGVIPDIVTSQDQTLAIAYLNALNQLIETTSYDKLKERYLKIKEEINND